MLGRVKAVLGTSLSIHGATSSRRFADITISCRGQTDVVEDGQVLRPVGLANMNHFLRM
jgi:hypothetical protein